MALIKLILVFALSWLMATATMAARDTIMYAKPGYNLEARLNNEGGGGLGDYWNALFELKSCTNEIVLFFLNGEECDILQGYCDAPPAVTPPTSMQSKAQATSGSVGGLGTKKLENSGKLDKC
ncbi:hypothetical protein GIB67_012950 [Kingdonia uniflora]|uniref:Prolamin-like domain-containing protein n=1 Tax=Kingdonia uniflora TaxID=39325 RepID=A0A7J7NG71_9MAGN|nr:hypothetical protein GIB67_012950 [Kingdonia uniflora]